MFCDDKYSQANAKRIKNQWNKLSWSDKVSVENIHYIYLTSTNFRTEHFFEPICWDGDQVSSFGKLRERPRLTLVSTGLLSTSPSLECFQLTDFFQQIFKKNISADLRVNRIRYAVKVGADDRCYLLLSAQERDYKNKFCLDYYSPFYDTAIGGTT